MPIVTEGLYKVTLEQNYRGEDISNTFFYLNTLGNDDEQDLCAQAFDEDIMDVIVTAQHSSLNYLAIRCENVTGILADALLTPSQLTGDLTGIALTTFIAAGIRLNRTTKETRNGQKRLAGQTEEVAEATTWLASYVIVLEAVGAAFAGQISTVGGIFDPVIARQDPITPTNWTINFVSGHTVNTFITSQVSRKV